MSLTVKLESSKYYRRRQAREEFKAVMSPGDEREELMKFNKRKELKKSKKNKSIEKKKNNKKRK